MNWYINLISEKTLIVCYEEFICQLCLIVLHFNRPHDPTNCYQFGYMENRLLYFSDSGECPSGPPEGGVWFMVSVEVTATQAIVSLDGEFVHTDFAHFPLLSHGGIMVPNGHGNVVSYRKCMISF